MMSNMMWVVTLILAACWSPVDGALELYESTNAIFSCSSACHAPPETEIMMLAGDVMDFNCLRDKPKLKVSPKKIIFALATIFLHQ